MSQKLVILDVDDASDDFVPTIETDNQSDESDESDVEMQPPSVPPCVHGLFFSFYPNGCVTAFG